MKKCLFIVFLVFSITLIGCGGGGDSGSDNNIGTEGNSCNSGNQTESSGNTGEGNNTQGGNTESNETNNGTSGGDNNTSGGNNNGTNNGDNNNQTNGNNDNSGGNETSNGTVTPNDTFPSTNPFPSFQSESDVTYSRYEIYYDYLTVQNALITIDAFNNTLAEGSCHYLEVCGYSFWDIYVYDTAASTRFDDRDHIVRLTINKSEGIDNSLINALPDANGRKSVVLIESVFDGNVSSDFEDYLLTLKTNENYTQDSDTNLYIKTVGDFVYAFGYGIYDYNSFGNWIVARKDFYENNKIKFVIDNCAIRECGDDDDNSNVIIPNDAFPSAKAFFAFQNNTNIFSGSRTIYYDYVTAQNASNIVDSLCDTFGSCGNSYWHIYIYDTAEDIRFDRRDHIVELLFYGLQDIDESSFGINGRKSAVIVEREFDSDLSLTFGDYLSNLKTNGNYIRDVVTGLYIKTVGNFVYGFGYDTYLNYSRGKWLVVRKDFYENNRWRFDIDD